MKRFLFAGLILLGGSAWAGVAYLNRAVDPVASTAVRQAAPAPLWWWSSNDGYFYKSVPVGWGQPQGLKADVILGTQKPYFGP